MSNFREYDRTQRLLMPPDLKDWVADDDLAHFIVEAVERVDVSAFHVSRTGAGKAQYHPRMMLALLIYCYANGIFSSRRIEQATHRHVSVRYIAANTHPDHDTIARFRRNNGAAFEAAFSQVLILASELGVLKVGMVSVDGTRLDANASRIKSVRYDRILQLRKKLASDIAELMARAEEADHDEPGDGLSLPDDLASEIARRRTLKDKLDAAAKRLEDAARDLEGQNGKGQNGKDQDGKDQDGKDQDGKDQDGKDQDGDDGDPPPVRPDQQTNLTDPDSVLMRKSVRHEYRQSYNGQAIVDADGSQLVLATDVYATSDDRAGLEKLIDQLCDRIGKPETLLADTGFAGSKVIEMLDKRGIEPLIAIGRQERRPYDFRPLPDKIKPPPPIVAPWRVAMQNKLQDKEAKDKYTKRKSTVEPVFGIIKSVMGFNRFHLRSLEKVKLEWNLVTLAYNFKRLAKLAVA